MRRFLLGEETSEHLLVPATLCACGIMHNEGKGTGKLVRATRVLYEVLI